MNTIGKSFSQTSGSKEVKGLRGASIGSNSSGASTVTNGNAIRQTAAITGNMLIAKMIPGTTFSGDIIDVRGSAIKILLEGDKTLDAASQDSKNLNIGDHITFNVSSNNGKTVVIKPLKINSFNTNVLLKALEAAEVPANEKNINIVKAMMKNEMSIDKNSLSAMIKKVDGFVTENPEDIVTMERHNIPITQENINQFEAYKNCEHRIIAQTETVAEEIPTFIKGLLENEGQNEVKSQTSNIIEKLINIISEDDTLNVENKHIVNNETEGVVVKKQINSYITQPEEDLSADDEAFLNKLGVNEDGVEYTIEAMKSNVDEANLPVKEKLTKEQVLNNLSNLKGQELMEFVDSKEFKEYVKDSVSRTFELDINRLGEDGEEVKENVKNLYERLENKTEDIINLTKNLDIKDNHLNQTVSNMRNNLQFMQDLSSMAAYIQLPVKFNESKAHGDLYVFNRKKGQNQEKDNITAFLHLDLEHLGATDINVTLEKSYLKTEFSISDNESLEIVEKHLDELKERLEKRGFIATVTASIEVKEKDLNQFEKVLETDKPQISIKRYSFDVRA